MISKRAYERVINFVERYCSHVKGEMMGKPLLLEDWQKDFIRNVFGEVRADGTRKYRYAYLEVPRKNGKSSLASALALYMLLADGENGAEVYCAAANREQANIIFEIASGMVKQNRVLSKKTKSLRSVLRSKDGKFKSLSKESKTKHGLNASCVIVDELHAHPDRELFDVLVTSTGSRRQPLTIILTTAGIRDETSIGWLMHKKAVNVLDGIESDDAFYPVVYSANPDDNYASEKVWKRVNPNYGISVHRDYLSDQYSRTLTEPSYISTFKRLFLNIWTGTYDEFITVADWAACSTSVADKKGDRCVIGVDLGSKRDFTSVVLVFEDFSVMPFFWIPKDSLNIRKNREIIRSWVMQGHIELTPGNVTDYNYLKQKIRQFMDDYDVTEIAYDPWNATQTIVDLLADGAPCVEFRQGMISMSPALKELERLVLERKLKHGGNPVLSWMNGNMVVKSDPAGNIKPDKNKSAEKIDGMVALTMAVGRMIFGENTTFGSIWDSNVIE